MYRVKENIMLSCLACRSQRRRCPHPPPWVPIPPPHWCQALSRWLVLFPQPVYFGPWQPPSLCPEDPTSAPRPPVPLVASVPTTHSPLCISLQLSWAPGYACDLNLGVGPSLQPHQTQGDILSFFSNRAQLSSLGVKCNIYGHVV